MSYNVYRVAYAGIPREHHAIFVEMNNDQSGWLFQVAGNIMYGQEYQDKRSRNPEQSTSYRSKVAIGTVAIADFARIKPTLESIPPPKKQFEGELRLYPEEPLRRCQEWTQEAINALFYAGILN